MDMTEDIYKFQNVRCKIGEESDVKSFKKLLAPYCIDENKFQDLLSDCRYNYRHICHGMKDAWSCFEKCYEPMMNCEIQNYFKSCSCYLKRTDKVSAPKDSVSEVCFKNILCSRAPLRGKGPMQQGNKPSLEELMSCASESLVSCGNYNNPVVPMLDNGAHSNSSMANGVNGELIFFMFFVFSFFCRS